MSRIGWYTILASVDLPQKASISYAYWITCINQKYCPSGRFFLRFFCYPYFVLILFFFFSIKEVYSARSNSYEFCTYGGHQISATLRSTEPRTTFTWNGAYQRDHSATPHASVRGIGSDDCWYGDAKNYWRVAGI